LEKNIQHVVLFQISQNPSVKIYTLEVKRVKITSIITVYIQFSTLFITNEK